MNTKILVADDDPSICQMLVLMLEKIGYSVDTASNGEEALALNAERNYALILSDIQMPKLDGIKFLERLRDTGEHSPPVIILTGHASVESALAAMKLGAEDYITKPVNLDELRIIIDRAISKDKLTTELKILREQAREKTKLDRLIGKSKSMQKIFDQILAVAGTDSTVLILGETGTGKELVAGSIHYNSARRDKPFVGINAGALAETILESELFGHEKGSFTGAINRKKGKFELADGGTIFLDEIAELSQAMQVKLLRVLQEKSFERVGGNDTIKVDIRVIAATNKDLMEEVNAGRFRSDLYYRLNIFPINLPPLRERKDDIPMLASHFLDSLKTVTRKVISGFAPQAMEKLLSYDWPGNVRELENIVERAMIVSKGDSISDIQLPIAITGKTSQAIHSNGENGNGFLTLPMEEYFDKLEKNYLANLLERSHGSINRAAQLAAVNPKTLYKKMKKHGIAKEDFKP